MMLVSNNFYFWYSINLAVNIDSSSIELNCKLSMSTTPDCCHAKLFEISLFKLIILSSVFEICNVWSKFIFCM